MAGSVQATSGNTLANGSSAAQPKAAIEEAQDRFLRLLVTQMKSQDPLNPLDNAQVTTQMAQISSVTGIEKLNRTMEGLVAMFNSGQTFQAAGMIGRGVLTEGNRLTLQDGAAVGGYELAGSADKVTVSITDAAGRVIDTVDLGAQSSGVLAFQWDGQTRDGGTAANGRYGFSIEAVQAGNQVAATPLTYGTVGSVSLGSRGATLNVNGLGAVEMSAVRQIL